MKDVVKNIIIIVIVVGVVSFIAFTSIQKDNEYKEISKYVNDHKEELETIANEYLSGNEKDYSKDYESIKVYKNNGNKLVYFKLKEYDNSFYYSSIDRPAVEDRNIDLIELGGNKYKWQEDDTEGITTKIIDNWYFYKKTK